MLVTICIKIFCGILLWAGYESLKEDLHTFGNS